MSLADEFALKGKVETLQNLIGYVPEARRDHFKTALANAKTLEQLRAIETEIFQSLPKSA